MRHSPQPDASARQSGTQRNACSAYQLSAIEHPSWRGLFSHVSNSGYLPSLQALAMAAQGGRVQPISKN